MKLYSNNNKEVGHLGESLACEFLEKNGYKIIERNKHFSKYCEIDIIAQIKNTLVFVEVKTRKNNNLGTPFNAITQKKYKHICTGALSYLKETESKCNNYRIDAIAVVLEPKLDIQHLQNISL